MLQFKAPRIIIRSRGPLILSVVCRLASKCRQHVCASYRVYLPPPPSDYLYFLHPLLPVTPHNHPLQPHRDPLPARLPHNLTENEVERRTRSEAYPPFAGRARECLYPSQSIHSHALCETRKSARSSRSTPTMACGVSLTKQDPPCFHRKMKLHMVGSLISDDEKHLADLHATQDDLGRTKNLTTSLGRIYIHCIGYR
jgi:hypothetical protein